MPSSSDAIAIATEVIDPLLLQEAAELYAQEPYKPGIWQWQFSKRFGRSALAITARHSGKLIGFNATMPVNVWNTREVVEAYWSCDFIVHEEYRGKGIGSRIKEEMIRTLKQPVMSLGISDDAMPILLKKGWFEAGSLPVSKKICRPSNMTDIALLFFGLASSLPFKLRDFYVKAAPLKLVAMASVPSESTMNLLWDKNRSVNHNSIVKNHEYMVWRYQQYPLEAYKFVLASDEIGAPIAFLVYRVEQGGVAEVVDYIGGCTREVVKEFSKFIASFDPNSPSAIVWRSSSVALRSVLKSCGYVERSYATRFVCNSDDLTASPWSLTVGDSDGDFLKVAKQRQLDELSSAIVVSSVHESELDGLRDEWTSVLTQSRANPLFMSWEWQISWWETWGENTNYDLCFLVFRSRGKLVGIAPLFRIRGLRRFLKEIHFVGNAWRIEPTVRSEYISPVFKESVEASLVNSFSEWVARLGFNVCLVAPDVSVDLLSFYPADRIVRQKDVGYRIHTQGSLEVYMASLGSQTRLKAFNRGAYLSRAYREVMWTEVPLVDPEIERFFERLNELHARRWGAPCFNEKALIFHFRLIKKALISNSIRPMLHYLKVNGEVVSASYNLIVHGVMYNIQSGYLEDFDKKVSLGTLHFGKLIGMCFEAEDIECFDLLAGAGKHTDYKRKFKGEPLEYSVLQIFSNSMVTRSYRAVVALKPTVDKLMGRQK